MAGYGNITGYEPTETPGAYRFMDKSGSPWLLSGPSAEDLKAKLDATAGLQQQVAGPGTGVMTPAELAKWQQGAAAQGQANLETPPDLAAKEAALAARAAKQAPPAGQPAPAQPPAASGDQGRYRPVGGGLVQDAATGEVGRFRGPSAGSKGGLELRGETRAGVQPLDPEALNATEETGDNMIEALKARQAAELEQATLGADHQKAMEKLALDQAAEAQHRDAEISRQVGEFEQKYDKAAKDVSSTKIDPKGGSSWLDVLAVGLGSIGATLTKSPNYALEIVQRKIDRNVAAQESALNVKRETKNDLAKMLEVTKGDRKLARAALDAAYTRKAQAVFESRAATTGDKVLKAQHTQQAIQLREANLLKEQALKDAAKGQVTQSYVNRPAVAPSAGGFVAEKDQVGVQSRLVDLEKKKQELAAGPKDESKGGETSAAAVQRAQGVEAAERALDRLEVASGKAGTVVTTGALGSKESQELGSQAQFLAPILGRAFEGNAPNESTMDAINDGLTSSDKAKRAQAIKAARSLLQDIKRSGEAKP